MTSISLKYQLAAYQGSVRTLEKCVYFPRHILHTISAYLHAFSTIETISCFLDTSLPLISREQMEQIKVRYPLAAKSLDLSVTQQKGTVHSLHHSLDKKLLILAQKVFSDSLRASEQLLYRLSVPEEEIDQLLAPDIRKKRVFFGMIQGISIIDDRDNPKDCCHHFALKCEAMLQKERKLFRSLTAVGLLLKFNGYCETEYPQLNSLAVYYDSVARVVLHYGRVVRVNENQEPTVQSKFGDGYVYEHPRSLVLPNYGDSCRFFHKNIQ